MDLSKHSQQSHLKAPQFLFESDLDDTSKQTESTTSSKPNKKRIRIRNQPYGFQQVIPKIYHLIPNGDDRFDYPKKIVEYLSIGDWGRLRQHMLDICMDDLWYISQFEGNSFVPSLRV